MSAYDYELVCIGSGPAGQRAAIQAAKLGKRVAIVERQRSVGEEADIQFTSFARVEDPQWA